jgi:hypothetical protein
MRVERLQDICEADAQAVRVGAQAVDGYDAGVFQAAGDLGFQEEAGAAVRIVGVPVLDLFEGNLAVQLFVASYKHLSQPPLAWGRRMRKRCPDDVEAPTVGARVACGSVGGTRVADSDMRTKLACTSGSVIRCNSWRTELAELTAARLFSGSLLCRLMCSSTSGSSMARRLAERAS